MTTLERLPIGQIRLDYPDEEVRLRVLSFLRSRHFPSFRKLAIVVEHGVVCVSGVVPSFYEKQVALTSCQHVPGVLSLIDQIAVEEPLPERNESRVATRLVG